MSNSSTYTTRLLKPDEHASWNAYVASDPAGDVLQTTAWGDLKAASGWSPTVLASLDGKTIRGGMMLLRRALPLGRSILYAPRGPVLDWSDTETLTDLVSGVRVHGKRTGAILVKIDPPTEDPQAATALQSLGFQQVGGEGGFGGTQPRCVMQLDLAGRTQDELLASFHQKWRYNIRLAGKKGVTIRCSDNIQDLRDFYNLLLLTAKRDGFRVRDYAYFERMWNVLADRGWMRLFLGEVEGEPVCGALSYLFGDRCWYTYGASANVHREKMPNYLMQWDMIRWAHDNGCRWYDFRGVSCTPDDPNDKTAGLNRFKSGFQPRFVRYIGEFDLPLHRSLYWAWTAGMPRAKAFLKRRAAANSPEEG